MASISANGSRGHHKFTLNVWESYVSAGDSNYSTVNWELILSSITNGYDWYYSSTVPVTYSVNINGTVYNGNIMSYDGRSSVTVASNSLNITHNNDGNKSIDFSFSISSINVSYLPGSASNNGNMNLTYIPRQANITNAPSSFTDEGNPSFTYSNPANASMKCWLDPLLTGTHYAERTITGTGGTYTWNLTETERNQLRQALTNATNSRGTCRIGLNSYIGSSTFKSVADRTLIIVNANPIFNSVNVYDSNTTTKALTGNNKTIIKGYSNVKSVFNPANVEPKKYATLKTYMADTLSSSYSSTQEVSILNKGYTKSSIKTQVIDSRGNSSSITIDFTKNNYNFINYQDIVKNSISVNRSDGGVGKFVTLKFNGTYWNGNFGAVNNELEVSYKYKKTTSSQYVTGTTTIIPTINNNEFSFDGLVAGDTLDNGFDINSTYDIIVTVSDKLSTIDFQAVIGAGSPAIAIYGNKVALGDKYDTSLGGIQLWGDIYINGQLFSRGDE